MERQSRRTVRRVVANPGDIQRYTAEFFALAKSVRAAQKSGGNAGGAGITSRRLAGCGLHHPRASGVGSGLGRGAALAHLG